jgi:hypothetical protein
VNMDISQQVFCWSAKGNLSWGQIKQIFDWY